MPKYKIVVEITTSQIFDKEFEAENFDAAKNQAENENWDEANDWNDTGSGRSGDFEIRDELCEKDGAGIPDDEP